MMDLQAKLQIGRETRAMLERQAASLHAAIDTITALPETRAIATRYLDRVKRVLRERDYDIYVMAGDYGENGWAPGIAQICADAGRHEAAPNATLDGLPVSVAEAAAHRRLAA